MKLINLLLLLLFFVQSGYAQSFSFAKKLNQQYSTFKEESITKRRFKERDIEPLIQQLASDPAFNVSTAGHSFEERPIHLVKLGTGNTKVLFWSQMHGNESTATMALLDLFNFFRQDNDEFSDKRKSLLQKVSLYFLPMLNPDGAEKFQRRNALGIDINRDALRLTSPASQILKSVQDSLQPNFGFNLHDQSTYYSAGRSAEPATLSFLAPAYNFDQTVNKVRGNAMRLIGYLNAMLQQYIPGKVAKYSDEHEPRAFGDMIQKWGTSTILIESGGYPDDLEKQYIRKMNFLSLLTAIDGIANKSYSDVPIKKYYAIPENNHSLTDLLITNMNMVKKGQKYLIDIGVRKRLDVIDSEHYSRAMINDIGDLSTIHGYDELDGDGMEVYPGDIYPDTLQNINEVRQLNFINLLQQGYTGVVVKKKPEASYLHDIPLNIIAVKNYANEISLDSIANLVIKKGNQVRYVVVNGYVYDTSDAQTSSIKNTLVVK